MRKLLEKGNRSKAKITSILMAAIIFVSSVIYVFANQNVTVSVTQAPNIDVVLVKGQASTNLASFETDILNSLERKGIAKDKVKVSVVEAMEEVTETPTFNWTKDVAATIGEITDSNNGRTVVLKGNTNLGGKNAIWTIPTDEEEQEFTFDYSIDFGESFELAGMLLRVQKSGNTLKGYMLGFNNEDSDDLADAADYATAAIYEFTYEIGTNVTKMNVGEHFTFKQGFDLDTDGKLNVKVSSERIEISGGGLRSPVTYNLEKSYGSGYGFLGNHYAHTGVGTIGEFRIENIGLVKKVYRDFNSIIKTQNWTDESCKVIVNVTNDNNSQFSTSTKVSEIVSKFINQGIHYIGWGTSTNKTEMETTIAINNGNGVFADNSDYSAAIETTTDYIKNQIAQIKDSKYVIANENVTVKVDPDSEATGTDGKWRVEHDYEYFENNEGQYEESGKNTNDVISKFTKPGRYEIYHESDLVTEIYAHRKPVAAFSITRNGKNITLVNESVDLDQQSVNNGIKAEEWAYRKIGTNTWTPGKLTNLDDNSTYIVRLRVQDNQDRWSEPTTKYITTEDADLKPVAQFKIVNKVTSGKIEIIDESYDPTGEGITQKAWIVKKGSQTIYSGDTLPLDYKANGEGTYTISLVVTNNSGEMSEEDIQTFTVIADKTAPTITATPQQDTSEGGNINVSVKFEDKETGLKEYKYAITESTEEPTSWETVAVENPGIKTLDTVMEISGSGQWYLHVKATDMSGNETATQRFGAYIIQKGYSIEIKVVDSAIGGVQGVQLGFTGRYQDGREITINPSVYTTDSNGKVKLSYVPLDGISTIEIATMSVPDGYEPIENKILTLDTTTEKIVVDEQYTSEGLNPIVSDDGYELSMEMSLPKKKFELRVTTVDASNQNIKLSGAEYVLKYKGKEVARAVSEDGVAVLTPTVGLTTGVADDYVITQTKAAIGYKATQDAILSVTFGSDGSFQSIRQALFSGNQQVQIPSSSRPEVVIQNSRENDQGSFEVIANISDADNALNKLSGVEYKIKVDTNSGLSYVTEVISSDSDGNIRFSNLFGLGIVRLTFIQESAPTGYAVSKIEKYITIENENGTIEYNKSSISGVFSKIEDKSIYVNLSVPKKNSTNSLKISLRDIRDNSIGVEGVNFEIYKLVGNTKIGSGTTNENGEILIDSISIDGLGEVVYKIVPIEQTLTQISDNILISITYNNSGDAISAKLISGESTVVAFQEVDDEDLYRRQTEVTISTTVADYEGKATLVINKNEEVTGSPVEGAKYRIRYKYDGKVSTKTETTDSNGQIRLAIPDSLDVQVIITETQAAPGYVLDSSNKQFNLIVDAQGNYVPKNGSFSGLQSTDVIASNSIITVLEKGSSLRNPKIIFKVKKTDMSGIVLLTGVNFAIRNKNTGDRLYGITNSDGVLEFSPMLVTSPDPQIFEIEEIAAPSGYKLPMQPFVIHVKFTEENNIIRYDGETYLTGEELLSDKRASYDRENNILTLELDIKNDVDLSGNQNTSIYAIDVEKIDSSGNVVTGSQYDIEVRPYGVTGVTLKAKDINEDIEVPQVELTNSKTTILLTEVQEALGFGKDEQMKVVTVLKDNDGQLSWDPTTTSYDLQIAPAGISIEEQTLSNGTVQKVLKIRILAKTPEEVPPVNPSTPGGDQGDSNASSGILDLLKLEVEVEDGGTTVLNTAYKIEDFTYEVEVLNIYKEAKIKATSVDSKAKLIINTGNEQVGYAEELVNLINSTTYVNIQVGNSTGTTKTFALKIVKGDHNTGSIKDEVAAKKVTVTNKDEIETAIQTALATYEVTVPEELETTDVTVTSLDPTAAISISGNNYTTGTQTARIALPNDTTEVKFTIGSSTTADMQEYTLIIKRTYEEDTSVPAENDPNATFKIRLFNKHDGEEWTRTYRQGYHNAPWCCNGWWHFGWRTIEFEFNGAQRLPVFFKDSSIYGSHIGWGPNGGYYLLDGFSEIKAEARLVDENGVISNDVYETRMFRQNTMVNDTYGSHTANFKKDYKNKTVEFTITQEIPVENHQKFKTTKTIVRFDENGNVLSGNITQGLDTVDIAIGGISTGGVIEDISYPSRRVTSGYEWYLGESTDVYDEILNYNSIGKNELFTGLLNKKLDNRLNVVLNLQDVDTNDPLNGAATIIVSERDTTDEWVTVETLKADISNGTSTVQLSNTLANRHLRFTITQTGVGTSGKYTYTNPATSSIELEVWLDDDGNIKEMREISTPSAQLESVAVGGNKIEYTIFNEKIYNFSIDVTKLDENGNPLPGVRLETTTVMITDPQLNTGIEVDKYGSKLTDENGFSKLKIVLPTSQGQSYYGQTFDITIREYFVPDNYKAYKDIKVRVLFTGQGKIAVAPELIYEPEIGIVDLSKEYINDPEMSISLTLKDKIIEDRPSFEIENVDSIDEEVKLEGVQYRIVSWDKEEYEKDHITFKEQQYSSTSDSTGVTVTPMEKAHALKTIIYEIREVATPTAYETIEEIVLEVTYDEEGKMVSVPKILTEQKINGVPVVSVVGNPTGHTMINLKVIHELRPKFTINVTKYDTKLEEQINEKVFIGTSQVMQENGEYGEVEERITSIYNPEDETTKIGFKKDHQRTKVLYTIYEITGNTETKRGQIEVEFDAYANVLSAVVVDETNPKNYINTNVEHNSTNYINARIETEEFRIKIILKSLDESATYSLEGARFDIQNQYEEVSDINQKTDSAGNIIEVVGEVYRAETMTYTIKQVEAPEDYDLIENITFNITFGDNGEIINHDPIRVPDKFTITSAIKDEDGNNMEMEIFTEPSDRETLTINAKDEDDSSIDIPFAIYDVKAVVVSSNESEYMLTLEEGTGSTDLGPDKRFFNKTIQYTITQTEIDSKYMIYDKEIKVTVRYDIDGTVKEVHLLSPTDGTVKITNPETGESTTDSLMMTNGGFTVQLDMVNKRKTIMQLENQSTENSNEKIANNTFKIIEQGKSDLYSDTKQTGSNGIVDMYVGPYYRAGDEQEYVEKTYVITNETPAFGFVSIPESTFTLRYDKDGRIIGGEVNGAAKEYLAIELITEDSELYDVVDVRILVESIPAFTVGIEAISETTGASITGMKYEIRQSGPTTGTPRTLITNNGYIAHADMGATQSGQMITYEIVEKEVARGYKFRSKDNVIGRFEVQFDTDGYIINNINGQRINIIHGNEYISLNPNVDKREHYDIDLKINYEESEDFIINIKNVNKLDNADYIISDFTANWGSDTATGTTDENGTVSLSLGKRAAEERGSLSIVQSNVQGSYAQLNTIGLRIDFDENGKIIPSSITQLSGNYATINVSFKIIQPINVNSYVLELEVYNNPQTTFRFENVDQGDDEIKLQGTFVLQSTTGIPNDIEFTTDENGLAETGKNGVPMIESVPKRSNVTYQINQNSSGTPGGYGTILPIRFRVDYDQDGLITSVSNLGNGISTADGTTVELTKIDNYTIYIKIKSKKQFQLIVETMDAYDESIKLGAQVYIRESANRKSLTLDTSNEEAENFVQWGEARGEIGTNSANTSLTYEVRLTNSPATPDGIEQTYYRDQTPIINIRVTFDQNGNMSSASYTDTPYTSNNCIIETEIVNNIALKIKVKYIPNLTINISRKDQSNGKGMSGSRMSISSNLMRYPGRFISTDSNGNALFETPNRIVDESEVATYTIIEQNPSQDYNYQQLPSMQVQVRYDANGYISAIDVSHPEFMKASGEGTRRLDVEISSYREARVMLYNTDYFANTTSLAGTYSIYSSKGEKSDTIVTIGNGGSSSTSKRGTPVKLGRVYAGESVTYTLHNESAQRGYEIVGDIQFIVHYGDEGTITILPEEFSDTDKLKLDSINQSATQNTAHINLEVRSKPVLLVKFDVKDKTYDQPIEKIGFELEHESGRKFTVDALTDENGELEIPVVIEKENTVEHYVVRQITTNGGYVIPETGVDLTVKYDALGTVDEDGTFIRSDDYSVERNYATDIWKSSRLRGIKINVRLQTKLGIGIIKEDRKDGSKIPGVTFKITEEEIIGGSETNTYGGITDGNGEMTAYTRYIEGTVQKVRYTITEVSPPAGYRPIEDIVLEVTFANNGRVQSVVLQKNMPEIDVNPSTTFSGEPSYELKVMPQGRQNVHIQITVKNDDKVRFKIVNLDKHFEGTDIDVPIEGSTYDVTVVKDGSVVDTYDTTNGNPLTTNKDGVAGPIEMDGPGTLQIDFSQATTGKGFRHVDTNKGFIKVVKEATSYTITYNDSTDGIKYEIDENTGEVIIYLYNENQFSLNLSNVDIDDNTILAANADQKVKAYYGELDAPADEILSQEENVITYNNGYEWNILTGNEVLDLGNTYSFIEKKVILEIETVKPAAGYTQIGKVYIVIEFDKYGKISKITDEINSERLLNKKALDDYEVAIFIGFGNLNKWNFKLIKESSAGVGINGAEFMLQTYVNDIQTDIGIPVDPDTVTTEPINIPGTTTVMEDGVFSQRGIQTTGTIKIEIDETEPAPGYIAPITGLELTFDVETDNSDPDEPRPVIRNEKINNTSNAKVEVDSVKREIKVTVFNEPQVVLELEKIDEEQNILQGVEFLISTMVEGEPSTYTDLGKYTTDENGRLNITFPTQVVNSNIILSVVESKTVGYKLAQPINLRIRTTQDGSMDPNNVNIISGENKDDGQGGAKLTGITSTNISLQVENIYEEGYRPFALHLIKEDSRDSDIKLSEVQFQVKITPQVGPAVYEVTTSDETGELIIPKIVGEGDIKIELQEVAAPNGYKLGENDGYNLMMINKSESGLELISSTLGMDSDDVEVDQENRIITAHIPNELEAISIGVHKIDADNGMNLSGSTFELTDVSSGASTTLTSSIDGMMNFTVDKKIGGGTYKYTLEEISAPYGYKVIEEIMEIDVEYDEDGNIIDVIETGANILLTEQTDSHLKVDVSNEQEDLGVPTYTVEIINTDKVDNSIVIPNSIFDVSIEQEGGSSLAKSLMMDGNGSAIINNINGIGNISIKIKEQKSGDGYIKDINTKTVNLNRDARTGKFVILSSENAYPIYDEANNKITIYVSNEKESGVFSFVINKENENGNLITENEAEFEVNIDGNIQTIRTDANGQAIIKRIEIPDKDTFDITVKETKAPDGYVLNEELQVISVDTNQIYGSRELKQVSKKEGTAILINNVSTSGITTSFINKLESGELPDELYLRPKQGTAGHDGTGYTMDEEYVDRVSVGTTIEEFLNNMEYNGTVTIYDKNGEEVTDYTKLITTNSVIKVSKDDQEISRTIVVVSDTSEDGRLSILDVSQINTYFIEEVGLEGARLRAADHDGNGRISIMDLSRVNTQFIEQP